MLIEVSKQLRTQGIEVRRRMHGQQRRREPLEPPGRPGYCWGERTVSFPM